MNNPNHSQKGFALLLAIIVSSIVLTVGLSILSVTLKQLNLGNNTLRSEGAFQTAVAGMDCLRFLRSTQASNFINNGRTVNIDCFELGGLTMTDMLAGSNGEDPYIQVFQTRFDWDISSDARQCIQIDTVVLDARSADRNWLTLNHGNLTCDEGSICTTAFVQGFNVACGNVTGNPAAVVRELSAEF